MENQAVASKTARNHFFDLLKMILAMLVIITHVSWSDAARKVFVFPLIIDMAVPLFLIISAYIRTKKIESVGIKKYLSIRYTVVSFLNIIIAYLIVAGIEILLAFVMRHFGAAGDYSYISSVKSLVFWFFTGLSGPGSYYVPVLIQLIVAFPLLYLLFKSKLGKNVGLLACAVINLAYEILVYFVNIGFIYRLFILRYTLILGFGIYLAMSIYQKREKLFAVSCLVIGLALMIVNAYVMEFPLFYNWKSTSMICAPFAYGVMFFLTNSFTDVKKRKIYVFGKASYHIFLTQMVFYKFFATDLFNKILPGMASPLCEIISAVISIVICFTVGLLFWFGETKIRKLCHISH